MVKILNINGGFMKKRLYFFICLLFFVPSILTAYEQVPEDAKASDYVEKVIDNSTDNVTDNITESNVADNKTVTKSRIGKNTILNLSGINAEKKEVVLVDKNLKMMYVAVLEGDNMNVVKEFPILTGRVDGDKLKRGDEKTPEGVYYVLSYSSGEELVKRYGNYALIYGAGSFPLNYPNIVDKIRRKTGGGIWIHGTKPDLDKRYTQGCVALNNTDFMNMYKNVKVGTPVIIAENLTYSDNGSYEDNRENLYSLLDNYTNAWKNNNKELFKSMFHKDFMTPNSVKSGRYVANKLRLMDRFPEKDIENYNTKIFMKDNGYVLFDTDQFYCAENLSTYTNKRYYFASDNGALKLISEEVYQKDMRHVPNMSEKINKFLDDWKVSWENKEIDKYMGFYNVRFKAGGENYTEWKNKKKLIFSRFNKISVNIKNVRWYLDKGNYVVDFVQEYSADGYKDSGRKRLYLSGCPSNFKILSEEWSRL